MQITFINYLEGHEASPSLSKLHHFHLRFTTPLSCYNIILRVLCVYHAMRAPLRQSRKEPRKVLVSTHTYYSPRIISYNIIYLIFAMAKCWLLERILEKVSKQSRQLRMEVTSNLPVSLKKLPSKSQTRKEFQSSGSRVLIVNSDQEQW